jgi:hypothetical protein
MHKEPSLLSYLMAFAGNWLSRMSGPIGVFLSIYATFTKDPDLKQGFWIASVACFLLASYGIWAHERRRVLQISGEQPSYLPQSLFERLFPPELLPLSEACRQVHDRFRGTNLRGIVESFSKEPASVLDTWATYIENTGVTIFGTKQPSRTLELLPRGTTRAQWFATALSGKLEYEHLCIRRSDLRRVVNKLRALDNNATPE